MKKERKKFGEEVCKKKKEKIPFECQISLNKYNCQKNAIQIFSAKKFKDGFETLIKFR